jgi:hypothetical protein
MMKFGSVDIKYMNPILNNLLPTFKFHAVLIASIVKGKVKLSLCLEGVWGNGRIDLYFLDLGTSWR